MSESAVPSAIKASLFAAYPLYIPIYLAEFKESESDRNVTLVAFATTSVPVRSFPTLPSNSTKKLPSQSFAMYPSFIEEPQWMPFSTGVELKLSGSPIDPSSPPTPGALGRLVPQLDLLTSDVRASKLLGTVESVEEIESHPHAMAYSEYSA